MDRVQEPRTRYQTCLLGGGIGVLEPFRQLQLKRRPSNPGRSEGAPGKAKPEARRNLPRADETPALGRRRLWNEWNASIPRLTPRAAALSGKHATGSMTKFGNPNSDLRFHIFVQVEPLDHLIVFGG